MSEVGAKLFPPADVRQLVDETRLVAQLKRRDEAAFNELVRIYQGQIYRLLLRMLRDSAEAEDVAQEVFVTVFKAIDGFRGDSKLSTWLFRVATNHGKNRIKYHARRAREAQREYTESTEASSVAISTGANVPRPDHQVEGLQAQRNIQLALAKLDDAQRELVVLRDLQHLTYEEIQRITGLAAGTVKSRLHRARLALHNHYVALHSQGDAP